MDLNTLSVILNFHFFELCLMIFDDILCIFHGNMKSERRGISYNSFCRRNFGKSLDMNFISSKKHESIFVENEPTFLFLGEVIPIIMGEVIPIHYAVGRPPGRLIGGVGALAPTITGGVGGGSPPP